MYLDEQGLEHTSIVNNDERISYACMVSPDCHLAKMLKRAGIQVDKWCPACVDMQPLTFDQAQAHHKDNEIVFGPILPYQHWNEA